MKIPVVQPSNPQELNRPETRLGAAAVRNIPNMPNVGDAIAGVGQQVSESATMLKNALNLAEKTKAQNLLSIKIQDIQARAEADQSLDNASKYHSEIDSAVREASSALSIPSAKDNFLSEAAQDAGIAKIKVNNDFLQRNIYNAKAELKVRENEQKEQFINAASPYEQQNAILSYEKLIDDKVAAGFTRPDEAAQLKIDRVNDWGIAKAKVQIYNDTSTTEEQSGVLAELKKGTDGEYSYLPTDTRTKMIEEAQKRIFQNNQTYKKDMAAEQYKKNDTFVEKIANDALTLEDIDKEMMIPEESGGLPRKTLLTYQNGLRSRINKDLNYMLTEKTADKEPTRRAKMVNSYLNLINNYIDDKTDMWVAREKLAEAWKDGVIDGKEAKILNPLKKSLIDISENRETSKVKRFINSIWSKLAKDYNATDEEIAVNIKRFLGTESPNENTVKEITRDYVKSKIPGIDAFPEEGVEHINNEGKRFIITPLGDLLDKVTGITLDKGKK